MEFRITVDHAVLLLFINCFHKTFVWSCNSDVSAVDQCITPHTQIIAIVEQDPTQIFRGMDVEIIRQLCSTLVQAQQCLKKLNDECPEYIEDITKGIRNISMDVHAVCTYKNIYEVYAMHQTCYIENAEISRRCYADYSQSEDVQYEPTSQEGVRICRSLQTFLNCVKTNIEGRCTHGQEAARVMDVLITTAVKLIDRCQVQETTTMKNSEQQTAPSSQGGNKSQQDASSANTLDKVMSRTILLATQLLCLIIANYRIPPLQLLL